MEVPDKEKPPAFDPYTYEGSPHVEVFHSYIMVACGTGLFLCINLIAIKIGPPSSVTGDIWRWRNTMVSFLHAAIVGTGVLYCLLFKQMFDDPVLFCDYFSYLLVAFSEGYFIYDFVDYVYNKRLVSNYEVILHHIIVIWSFWYSVHYRVNVGYTVIALMTEVNSIFLHARKLMQFDKWPFDHWLYLFIVILNLLTFLTFRFYGIFYVGYGLVTQWQRITFTFAFLLSVAMFVMYIINPVLLWRLFKNDVLRQMKSKKLKVNGNRNVLNETMAKVKPA